VALTDTDRKAHRLSGPSCATCIEENDLSEQVGEAVLLDYKFSFPDGTDQEDSPTYTRVYQCPKCKDIVVQ